MHRFFTASARACAVVGLLAACPSSSDARGEGEGEGEREGEGEGEPAAPSTVQIFDAARIGSNGALDNFQVVRADIDVGTARVSSATLVVDLGTSCFPFAQWADNPPPAGQNWPADCDAFDRNFHFLINDPADSAVDDATVPLELVRAITPFGGPMHLEVDITDVVNGLVVSGRSGRHRLSAHITTYSDGEGIVSGSDGGWDVSARLDLVPGTPARNVVDVRSLFFGNLTIDKLVSEHVVELGEGERGALFVRTTGHGGPNSDSGCFGPAEEFCRRTHRVQIDDDVDIGFVPQRSDCADLCTLTTGTIPGGGRIEYCAENPTGSINSVRADRANWCPGSVTPPFDFGIAAGVGAHDLSWSVARIAEGGSWLTSLTVFVLR